MDIAELLVLAENIGFSHYGEVNMESLVPRTDIRDMCTADKCGNYGKSWSCPPSPVCGTIEENQQKLKSCSKGILVQTTGQMEDAFDMSIIRETEDAHKKRFDTLVRQTRLLLKKEGGSCIPLAAGGCRRCEKCTWPDKPCRYPEKLYPSMEACGLWVSDVCKKSDLEYNYGENTITFTSCILYKWEEK